MAKGLPDERLVYLALKGVLQSQDVHIRQEKKIRTIIQRQQNHAGIQHLIQEYGIDGLCQTAKALFRDQIFESTLKAKVRFPEVFEVSPGQTAERTMSEQEAARHEDAAIQNVTDGQPDLSEIAQGKLPIADQDERTETSMISILCASVLVLTPPDPQHPLAPTNATHQSHPHITSLYPVYLPFSIQHRLFARLQTLLEHACYTFASKRLPDVLVREDWTCPESVELNRWPKVLLTHRAEFHESSVAELAKPLDDLFSSIAQLRHTAVHRLRLTANRILQFVVDAEALVKLLRDDITLDVVTSIRQCLQTCIGEIERNKDLLEVSMATTKAEYVAKREELEREEREALEKTFSEDREYMVLAGRGLELALNGPNLAADKRCKKEEEEEEDMSEETEIDEGGGVGMSGKHSGWFEAA
jgi:hypothetical protein